MNFNDVAVNWDNERRVKRARIIASEISNSIPIQEQSRALFKHITLIDTSKGMIDVLNSKIEI